MNVLLTSDATRSFTLAAFFGLILGSSIIVARMIETSNDTDRVVAALWALAGGIFAFWITGLRELQGSDNLFYVFFCGSVAICAMILPGISGSFILLILGMYVAITDIVKRLPKLQVGSADLVTLAVFASGCAIGLILFSKVLRWLLARHEMATMSVLCGFMLGSLRKIWPFQREVTLEQLEHVGLTPEQIANIRADPKLIDGLDAKHRAFEHFLPQTFDSRFWITVGISVAALVLIFVLEYASTAANQKPPLRAEDHEPDE